MKLVINEGFIAALDDKAARNCAYSLDIEVIGTIGLILLSKKRRIIEDAVTYLNKLRSIGYRISDNLRNQWINYVFLYKIISI